MTPFPYLQENILRDILCGVRILDEFLYKISYDNIIATEQHSICFRITLYDPLYYLVVTIHDAILEFHFNIPSERIVDLSILDACNEVIKLLALRSTAILNIRITCNFFRLKERLVIKM